MCILKFSFSFEWGSQANLRCDDEYPDTIPDDCLVLIKDDHSVELHHVQQQDTSDDNLDDSCLAVIRDVVVTADLLKSLLRDRGKGTVCNLTCTLLDITVSQWTISSQI